MTEEERQMIEAVLRQQLWLDVSKKRLPVLIEQVMKALGPAIEDIKTASYESGKDVMAEAMDEA